MDTSLFVGYRGIYGFAIVEIHERIVIASKAVVIVEHRFRLCEMLFSVVEMRFVIGVDFVSSDRPSPDSLVVN